MVDDEQRVAASFSLGAWHIDGSSLTASRGRVKRPIEPRAYKVLRHLAVRHNQLVSIDELMEAHWGGSVVTPNAVTRVIAHLRKVLDDDAKQPTYIETVSRTGYRCIAPVAVDAPTDRRRTAWLIAAAAIFVVAAVGWWYVSTVTDKTPSVAVLPFQNMTGDPALDYLADGVAEEVINRLTRMPAIEVSAQSQSFRYRESELDAAATARELGVAYVVAGSVRRNGPNLRVSAQLVDASRGVNMWSLTEEHDILATFAGQDAISVGVAKALADSTGISVGAAHERRTDRPQPEAYDLYLRGRHIWHRRGIQPLQPAIDYFSEAVRIDPEFARGWAALATAYLNYPSYSPRGYATWHLAEGAAEKALALDPDIPEPYGVLATFAYTRMEWEKSEALYLEGIRRNNRSATAIYWYGQFLEITGKLRDSAHQFRRAIELDPTYQPPQLSLGFMHLQFRDVEGAAQLFKDLWDRGFTSDLSWMGNFMCLVLLGDSEAAISWIESGPGDEARKNLLQRFVLADIGGADDPDIAADLMTYFWRRPDYPIAIWMGARLGAYTDVFNLLNERMDRGRIIELRPLWAPGIELRLQPGYIEFLERVRLIDYWESTGWGDVCEVQGEGIVCSARDLTPATLRTILMPERDSRL